MTQVYGYGTTSFGTATLGNISSTNWGGVTVRGLQITAGVSGFPVEANQLVLTVHGEQGTSWIDGITLEGYSDLVLGATSFSLTSATFNYDAYNDITEYTWDLYANQLNGASPWRPGTTINLTLNLGT